MCDFSGKNNTAKWSKRLKNIKSVSGHVTYDVIIAKIWSKYLKSVNQPSYRFSVKNIQSKGSKKHKNAKRTSGHMTYDVIIVEIFEIARVTNA